MDKTVMKKKKNTKRHINKKQQQSGSKKSKKEKVRSLSAVAQALSMGCNLSDSPKYNKFNLTKKVFNECNAVDHSSVPRKIRSAMKKRGRESVLTDSEKLNHKFQRIESPQKDSIKKSKKQVVLGPITKDEQEVAETLYALAGMFPTNGGSNAENEVDHESSPKNSVSQEQEESTNASKAVEDTNLIPESSSMGAAKIISSETIGIDQNDLTGSADNLVATQSTAPKVNLQGVPMMVKSENGCKLEVHDSELSLEMGLNVSTESQFSHIGGKIDVEYETVGGIDCKQEQHIIKYQRENEGLTLLPGSTQSASAATNASCLQSSAASKAPHWLNAAICNSKHDLIESCSSGGKISEPVVHKKPWKSCAAHVHISQLIRSLEVPKKHGAKEPERYECHQTRVHQGSKCGVLIKAQNSNGTRNGNSFDVGTVHSASLDIFPETKNGILQQQCHYLDISLSKDPPMPAKCDPQKQNFNFLSLSLSLSAGGNGLKVEDCFTKGGSRRLEQFSKSQLPYFRSIQQQHGLMPIPTTPPNQHTSTSYIDQLPAAGPQVRLQQPHYYGTPLCGTNNSSAISYKLLKAVFKKDGTTTAGNSSQVSDGAGAVLLMKRSIAMQKGLPILGVFRSFVAVGVDPAIMGVGPAAAIPVAVKAAGLELDDIDLFEINEAFASQFVYCRNKLGLDSQKINVNGGAMAIGHPLGATGARCVATLLHEMKRRGKDCRYGVISMCIGTGMGAAAVFERGDSVDELSNARKGDNLFLSKDAR